MWRSPLSDQHAAAGGRFVRYGDCELVEHFGAGVRAEYEAVRGAAGVLDLSHRRKLRVTGADRISFLQGMLSNDIASLTPGQGCHATFLTIQGRVIADLRVYVMESEVLLDAEPLAARGLVAGLEKHVIADDVEIEDVTAKTVTLSIQGPAAARAMGAVSREPPPLNKAFDHVALDLERGPARVILATDTGAEGYQLLVPLESGADVWAEVTGMEHEVDLLPVGHQALNILRVEAGIPWYGVDMDESRIVLEVGLEDAISTTKGCYLGQEVVERASSRGHVNRRLTGLALTGPTVPSSGARVEADGKQIGTVTSAVESPALGVPIALAYIRREFLEPGTPVSIVASNGSLSARVTSLPFYGG